MTKTPVQFKLNGSDVAGFADSGENLLDFLRRRVGDLSPKYGCGQGACGTCTVIIDGEIHLSCLTFAETVNGRDVRTASGLGRGGKLSPLQTAFMDGFAAQCGFCTPGMLMTAHSLLSQPGCSSATPTRLDRRSRKRSRATSAGAPDTSRSSTRS